MSADAIVFDFGNVLAFFSHQKAAEQLAAYGDVSPEEVHGFLQEARHEDDFESGRLAPADYLAVLRREFKLRGNDAELSLAVADMFTPNPEVCALVPRLKPRYRLLLLSNTNALHYGHFRRQLAETPDLFDALVVSHEVGHRKPRPEVYAHCERLAGCPPRRCLFVDDLPANVEAARARGWQGVVYTRGDDLAAQLRARGVKVAPSPQPSRPA